jgi:hypothetical protein
MKTYTRTLKLVSSKLKKFNHDTNEWYYEEDSNQAHRIGTAETVSYTKNKEGDFHLHSFDGPAHGKDYYINGIRYSKTEWKSILALMKKEEKLANN